MDNDSIFNNLIIKDIKNKYNIYKNVGDGIINSNFFFIPLVITIFSLYFSFIQRKIGKSYDKEYKEKIVVLKNKEEDSDVIDEAWDKMKNKYDKLRNQQFNIFLVALLKCVLSYENLIGASFIVYCFYKVSEGYNLYKIDIKYLNKRLLKNKNNEEEFKKIVLEKIQVKMRFRHSTFHTMFYTFTLFFGYYLTKCRGFWDVTKMSNPIDPNSIIMNYIFGIKNVYYLLK
ncbi:hypothetical protein BCR32DRAFT_291791 [Anaeromyces robustus]|uniref:Uncharacterized protein n=1 Tax=Anaeromyces robustus TaxID=1754192 RepID=A0A1Y1XDE4_9FUNG|nr:hypothetical protein BCR32DRAFT_291791 [Anaeromyces robustus]|eukprot:ORX83811.1 hypothetical protein BCR32DRAFT_291791 [Anaeromyces robustus]